MPGRSETKNRVYRVLTNLPSDIWSDYLSDNRASRRCKQVCPNRRNDLLIRLCSQIWHVSLLQLPDGCYPDIVHLLFTGFLLRRFCRLTYLGFFGPPRMCPSQDVFLGGRGCRIFLCTRRLSWLIIYTKVYLQLKQQQYGKNNYTLFIFNMWSFGSNCGCICGEVYCK